MMTTTLGEAAANVLAKTPRPWNGEKITEPGIYGGIDMVSYHGDIADGPSISSSGLRTIERESPLHFWHDSFLNPDRPAQEQKDHFNLGSAVHTLLLGEGGFSDQFVIRPAQYSDWRTGAAKAWRDEMVALGKSVLVPDDLEKIKGIARMVAKEPIVQQGLFSGLVENSAFWKDKETGVWLKSRPDVLNLDADIIADLKTTASADGDSCQRAISEYGYHLQLALAAEGYEALLGREVPNDACVLIFVETKAPFAVNVKPIDAEAIWYGRRQIRRAVRRFAECLNTGEWPSYADSGSTAFLSPWLKKRLEFDAEHGDLPEIPLNGKAA